MTFDLLELIEPTDTILKQCIRAYTVVPKYAKTPSNRNVAGQKIVQILRKVNATLNKKTGLNWKKQWLETLPFKVQSASCKDWFIGRASIPLAAIYRLKEFGFGQEVRQIEQNMDYFCSTTGTVAKLPKEPSDELAWFIAAILCDGHIRKDKNRVTFFANDLGLIKKFEKTAYALFEVSGTIRDSKTNGQKPFYEINIANKPMVRFLNTFCQIPRGKKSGKIIVPNFVWQSNPSIKRSFLKGIFDTDGGKRSGGLGLTSASKAFRDQVFELLSEFGIKPAKDEWLNKKYNKRYYGLRFSITPKSEFLCRDWGAVKPASLRADSFSK